MIMAGKLQAALVGYVPLASERVLCLFTVTALLLLSEHARARRGASATFASGFWRGVTLTVLSGTCMDVVETKGVGDTGSVVMQICVSLVVTDALLSHAERYTHGAVQRMMRNSLTYTFGLTVSRLLRARLAPAVAGVTGTCMVALSMAHVSSLLLVRKDETLFIEGTGVAGVDIIRAVVLSAIPGTLLLPTLLALGFLVAGAQRIMGTKGVFLSFVTYACAISVAGALVAAFPIYQATALAVMVTVCCPSLAMQNMGIIVTMNLGTELFMWVMRDALRSDEAAALACVMVVSLGLMQTVFGVTPVS